jgi:diguanylate cyclase (GGDEF)-like protein
MEFFAATWNILSTLGIFTVVTILFSKIRQLLESESTMSRTDPLTGVMNVRAFSELMEYEILRLKRESSSFSIAYFDVDNFKQVNDQHGHRKGDELLKSIVTSLTQNLRKTDVVARMGGDEFIVYFPLTDQEAVKIATLKVMEELNQLLQINNWPTTISMGVVTCINGACDFDKLIGLADKLMYEVKQAGKNDVHYGMYSE